jgi:hypothetical protein
MEKDYPRKIHDLLGQVTLALNEDQAPELWYYEDVYGWFGWWNQYLCFIPGGDINPHTQNQQGGDLSTLQTRKPLMDMNYHVQKVFLNILPDFLAKMELEKEKAQEGLESALLKGYEALKDFQKGQ